MYELLLRRVGEMQHQSCIILTSREKPKEIDAMESRVDGVCSFQLSGLNLKEGCDLLKDQDIFGKDENWKELIEKYSGNPLALKQVAASIKNLFSGDISLFLEENITAFGDISSLLDDQFNRLSTQEKEVMYWLAIERESISLADLLANLDSPISKRELLGIVFSLKKRSMIESNGPAFFLLQPVVLEYVTNRLIEQIRDEITSENIELFVTHPLIRADAKDYIRQSQISLILKPLVERLVSSSNTNYLETKLLRITSKLQQARLAVPGYAGGNIINLLVQLGSNLRGRDFSNLFICQAYLYSIDLQDTNFAYAEFSRSVFTETFGGVLSTTFSPDGKLLVSGATDGKIHVWEVGDGRQLHTWKAHSEWVKSVAFTPDSNILVSGSDDQTIRIWDVKTEQCIRILTGHTDWVWCVAINPEGSLIASGSSDKSIRLWSIGTGQCIRILDLHTDFVWSVVFSPDGTTLASGSGDNTIRLWNIQTGECTDILKGHTGGVKSLAFNSDGSILASGSEDQDIIFWDMHDKKSKLVLHEDSGWIRSIAFNPDGSLLGSASEGQMVRLWRVTTGECLKTLRGHSNSVNSVSFNSDGKTLATGGIDQTVRLWDVASGQSLRVFKGHTNWIWSVSLRPIAELLNQHFRSQT